MSEKLKVQLEDEEGNIYYLKTDASSVYCEDGNTVETVLNNKIAKADINNTTVAFDEALSKSNINTDESFSTLFGKIKKWFADLKAHAFSDLIQNTYITSITQAPSAAVTKSLQDQIDTVRKLGIIDPPLLEVTTSGWNFYDISDISKYRYIIFDINDGNLSHYPSAIYPMYVFKICNSVNRTAILCDWNEVHCYACYKSDTLIGIYIDTAVENATVPGRQVTVYGVK